MVNGSSDKRLSFVFLLLLTAAALFLSFLIARPFLTPMVTAALLAVAIYPIYASLLRVVRNRNATALLAAVGVLIALLLPTVFIVNTVANETKLLYEWLSEQSSGGAGWEDYFTRLTDRPVAWIEGKTGISRQQLRNTAIDRLQDASASLLTWARSLAINITGTILDTLFMLFILFFLLRDGPEMLDLIGSILPLEPDRYQKLLHTISKSITANIYGVFAVSIAQGTLGAFGYWIAGLPNVMLWSVLTALLSMIPLAGALVVWGSGVVYLAATARWAKAIFLLAYGTGVISLADNIVRPLVLSGRVKLNTLLIFFSLLGGVKAFGIVGLFVGPIVVSLTLALVKMLAEENARRIRPVTPPLP
jgi:predicted PurR-regulated permease PerM